MADGEEVTVRPAHRLRAWLTTLVVALAAVPAHAALSVVATTTDLKSLVEAVGGDRVAVTALVPPTLDPHDFQPRPQDLARVKSARLVVRVGLDHDLWLDRLLQQAGQRGLIRGGEGYVDTSFGITLLEVRGAQVGPTGGHAHGAGNPHYWLDPANAEMITGTVFEALVRLDPANARHYEQRRNRFLDELQRRIAVWQQALAPLQGAPLIAYHTTWAYLARRFKLNLAAYIEPRPGIPPSPAHLGEVLRIAREQKALAVLRQPHESEKNAAFIATRSGARLVLVAASVGAVPQAADYFSLFDYNVATLAALAR